MGPKQLKITPQNQKSYKMQVIILFKQIPKNFSGPNPENTPLAPIRGQKDFKKQQIKTLKKNIKNCTVSVGLNPIPKQSIHLAKGFAKKYKGQIKSFFFMNF